MRVRAPLFLCATLAVAACSSDDGDVVIPPDPEGGSAPALGGGLLLGNGGFSFIGPLAPGSASFTMTPVFDAEDEAPPTASPGTGAFDVTIGASQFAAGAAESIAGRFTDYESNADYLVASVYQLTTDASGAEIGTVVHVVVPAAEVAPGATIALDGADRLALFATGDIADEEPSLAGAAVTGTITFTAGSATIGDTLTATLDAEFGEVAWDDFGGGGGGGGDFVAGTYNMGVATDVDVYCEGDLAGQEAAFAALGPDALELDSGTVELAVDGSGAVTIAGATIQAAFGASPLALGELPDAPPGVVAAEVAASGAGPAGTTQMARILSLEGGAAPTGFAGAAYASSGDGVCQIMFWVGLRP